MRQVLCAWLPNWPVQRLHAQSPELKGRALVLYRTLGQGSYEVVTGSPDAAACGVHPGMPLVEATALVDGKTNDGDLVSLLYDPQADLAALEELAQWAEQFAPRVAIEGTDPPDTLVFDLRGCERVYSSEEELIRQVSVAFLQRGLQVRLGLADTAGAAWGLARFGEVPQERPSLPASATAENADLPASGSSLSELSALPVEALRLSPATLRQLHSLGIRHVDELLTLPRASLPSRFPAELLERLNQAAGSVCELFEPCHPPQPWQARREFPAATDQLEVIESALGEVLEELAAELRSHGQGLVELRITLEREGGGHSSFPVHLSRPSLDVKHLLGLAQWKLETHCRRRARKRKNGKRRTFAGNLGQQPVLAVQAEVLTVDELEIRQQDFFEDASGPQQEREVARLMDRLAARLGKEVVTQPCLLAEAQPELAWRPEPLANRPPRPSAAALFPPGFRPLRLLPRPQPVEVLSVMPPGPPSRIRLCGEDHRLLQTWGPERIETGWWRQAPVARDYYRVELESGRHLWVFRSLTEGDWFLHGWFD